MFPLTFLALATLFLIIESTPYGNTTGAIQVKKYHVVTDYSNLLRNFVGATIACAKVGMKMASINSTDEQSLLQSAIEDVDIQNSKGYWIGAVTDHTMKEREFYWIYNELEMLTYTNWGSFQPQFYIYDLHNAICVRVGNYDKVNEPYKWQMVDCNNELYYICEEP
ncbi:hypothetical protein ABEB36_004516 [Hypothenemus hampei]|uniref:C-type lectin domain-containing protein n=1 Tax=Hypothenemus hampei TaxID=57062 RepID=A0ABD1F3X2_HYPHA